MRISVETGMLHKCCISCVMVKGALC